MRSSAVGLLIAHWGGAALRAGLLDKSEAPAGLRDPRTILFAAVAAVMLATCLFAAYVPARRASRVDPLVALRAE